MKTKQILEAMLETIVEKGWVQDTLYEEALNGGERIVTGVCLEGACNLTYDRLHVPGRDWYEKQKLPVGRILVKAIDDLFPGRMDHVNPWAHVINFNDDEATTKEDVILILKHAIDACN